VQVTLRGDAGYRAGDEARAAIEEAIATARCAVRSADVVVRVRDDGASVCPAEVEAVLHVGDEYVHASSAARTVSEAVGVVERQLSARLTQHTNRTQTARRVPRRHGR
jgi:hypothetical protein